MYEDPHTDTSPETTAEPAESTPAPAAGPREAAPPAEEKKKRSRSGGRIVALALACLILGGCLGVGGMLLASRGARAEAPVTDSVTPAPEKSAEAPAAAAVPDPTEAPTAVPAMKQTDPDEKTEDAKSGAALPAAPGSGQLLTAKEVYADNVSSTVGITTSITTNYWGYQTTSAASGSGFFLTDDGYILTNYHVVEDSNSITVSTFDNKSYDAKIVGYDESNDIAVLKIDAEGLTPVILGDSDALSVGDTVLAIGNPLGELTFSLTQGIVSAIGREVTFSSGVTMALIQTDCAINSGNSGGALFNLYGEVVGITNAKYSGSSGSSASVDNIGFAIPINRVRNIVESIIQYGYIVKPYIGVSVSTVSQELINYGIPEGAAIRAVSEDSPAQEAGLRVNDVITAVNGREIASSNELVNVIAQCRPGDTLELTVYRQGENDLISIALTVGEQRQDANPPAPAESEKNTQDSQNGGYESYGGGFPFGFGFGGWG